MEEVATQTIYPVFSWGSLIAVIIVLIAGVALLGVEVFITPGFGVGGVMGIILLGVGCVGSWVALGPTWGALVIVVTMVLSTIVFILGLRSKAAKKRLVLDTQQPHGGGVETSDMEYLVGAVGTAKSDLRPAGIAIVGDERVDVVSEGGFVDKGTAIKVVSVDGPRVIVAPAD